MNPKDRSMVARMAGNIAGPMAQVIINNLVETDEDIPEDFEEIVARKSVGIAVAVVERVDQVITGETNERSSK